MRHVGNGRAPAGGRRRARIRLARGRASRLHADEQQARGGRRGNRTSGGVLSRDLDEAGSASPLGPDASPGWVYALSSRAPPNETRAKWGGDMTGLQSPFRADHVGSLLRRAALREARGRHERGEISATELTAIEDIEIKALIAKQEAIGLRSITDGE